MESEEPELRKYFQVLEKEKRRSNTCIEDNMQAVTNLIESQINAGKTQIKSGSKSEAIMRLSDTIKLKKDELSKQLNMLKLSLKRRSHSIREDLKQGRSSHVSIKSQRSNTEVSSEEFEQYRKKRVIQLNRLRELKKLRELASEKRKQIQRKKQEKLDMENKRQLEQQMKTKQKMKEEKLKAIQDKIKQFEQNRSMRMSRLKSCVAKSNPSLPRYKQAELDFENEEERRSNEKLRKYKKDVALKFREYEFDNIKRHQKEYIERLKEKFGRSTRRSKTQSVNNEQKELGFKLIGKDEQNIQEAKLKVIKMKEFQQVTNKIKIRVNSQKNLEILIAKDKAENPMKYNFLRQKHLNDYQIYKDFRNFNMEIDAKQLGNSYLSQVLKKNREQNSKSRVISQKVVKTEASESQKKNYKNYLDDSRKNAKKKQLSEVEQLYKQYGSKSKVFQVLQKQSELQKAQTLQKIQKMSKLKTYNESLHAQSQIDTDYINWLKTRIKCLDLK